MFLCPLMFVRATRVSVVAKERANFSHTSRRESAAQPAAILFAKEFSPAIRCKQSVVMRASGVPPCSSLETKRPPAANDIFISTLLDSIDRRTLRDSRESQVFLADNLDIALDVTRGAISGANLLPPTASNS